MRHSEIIAYNRGVADLAAIAEAAADALRVRITIAPTRYNFAIGALEGIVGAAGDLTIPLPPDDAEPSTAAAPSPLPPAPGSAVPSGNKARSKEVAHGC